jgi:ribonuclease-3
MEFKDISQRKDETGSPVFEAKVVIEGIEGCSGTGYSKKESQQIAAKETLQRLRREPQFIDAVFAAKADRTKMEEEPVQTVPDIEQQENFIIEGKGMEAAPQSSPKRDTIVQREAVETSSKALDEAADEFSLDDITATPQEKSREDIIAEAEAAAFEEMQQER